MSNTDASPVVADRASTRPAGDATSSQELLDEVRRQQRCIFRLIAHFQRIVAKGAGRGTVLEVIDDIVRCVKVNFHAEERCLLHSAHRRYCAQCQTHRELIEELHVLHDALAYGDEVSALDLAHGLDALLVHYLVDDLFIEGGCASDLTTNSGSRLK